MTQDIIVSLKNVGVKYKKRFSLKISQSNEYWALTDINLQIKRGESIGIRGRNGAGKSTLLRVIAKIISPNRGTIDIQPGIHSGLLTLQTGFNLFLNGIDNAILKGLYLGVTREYIESKIPDIIELSGLEKVIKDPVSTYSAGMRARLGFATNYFCTPDLLLIDESLGVGDASFKEKSRELIRGLVHSDKTVVVVSHEQEALEALCDRILTIDGGVLKHDQSLDTN